MDTETRERSNGWACVDCLMLMANGTHPDYMTEAEVADWLAEIRRREVGLTDITLGRMFGEKGCGHDEADDYDNHAEVCEQLTFSSSPCDVCGSRLGGSRDAVTFWH